MQYGYNKDTDYKKLMDDAASKGNYAQAAIYEQMRNEKIAGEGLNQWAQTNQYANYLQGAGANTGWKNPYQEELDAAIKRLQENSGGAYKWDPENDTAMQEYRKTYLREGDRTMRDTLGAYAKQTAALPPRRPLRRPVRRQTTTRHSWPTRYPSLSSRHTTAGTTKSRRPGRISTTTSRPS